MKKGWTYKTNYGIVIMGDKFMKNARSFTLLEPKDPNHGFVVGIALSEPKDWIRVKDTSKYPRNPTWEEVAEREK